MIEQVINDSDFAVLFNRELRKVLGPGLLENLRVHLTPSFISAFAGEKVRKGSSVEGTPRTRIGGI